MRAWRVRRRAAVVAAALALAACAPTRATPRSTAVHPQPSEAPRPDARPGPGRADGESTPDVETGIDDNPALALGHPRDAAAPRTERTVCRGRATLSPDPKPEYLCCYPAKDLLVRPIRDAYPTMRACVVKSGHEIDGRVSFAFRIEKDGSVARVCTTTDVDDPPIVDCLADAILALRYPAQGDEEVRHCGLVRLAYPVTFQSTP